MGGAETETGTGTGYEARVWVGLGGLLLTINFSSQ